MMVYGSELLSHTICDGRDAPALVQFRIYISVLEILSKYVDT